MAKGNVLQDTIALIRKNFNPSFLGPVKGTDLAFATRRRIGSVVNAPLSAQETTFRQALSDARNQIVYMLSGKQINEAESVRLNAALPAATDEAGVFLPGLNRFEQEMESIRQAHIKAGTATRSTVGRQSIPPPPAGWRQR